MNFNASLHISPISCCGPRYPRHHGAHSLRAVRRSVDYAFTARMEDDLDEIAAGEQEMVPWLDRFYHGNGYRGLQNQLYRVEIHAGGEAGGATFKWSRENGSVIFPILSISGKAVTLGHLGDGGRSGLDVGDWVEIVDDDLARIAEAHETFRGENPESGK